MRAINSIASDARLMMIAQVIRQASQWIGIIILARLLTPSQFGVANMALVVGGVLMVLRDFGVGAAVIYLRDLSDRQISGIYWWNNLFGIFLSVLIFALAPAIAAGFAEPRATILIEVIAAIPTLTAVSALHQARLERELLFGRVALIELSGALLALVAAVMAGILGAGAWSLIYQIIIPAAWAALLLPWVSGWTPFRTLDVTGLRSVLRYSVHLAGYSLANYAARNGDNVLVGRYLGAQALGIYGVSYKIALYPVQVTSTLVARVLFPICAKFQNDYESFRRVFLVSIKGLCAVSFPIVTIIFVLSEEIVGSLFNSEWQPVAKLLRLLSIAALVQVVGTTVGVIYQARGKTDWMFKWGLFSGFVMIASVAAGLNWGVYGVAWAFLLAAIVLSLPGLYIPFSLIDLRIIEVFRAVGRLLLISILCGIVTKIVISAAFTAFGSPVRVVVGGGVFLLTYAFLVYRLEHRLSKNLWAIVSSRARPYGIREIL